MIDIKKLTDSQADVLRDDILTVLETFYLYEKTHFEESDDKDHIFLVLDRIRKTLAIDLNTDL